MGAQTHSSLFPVKTLSLYPGHASGFKAELRISRMWLASRSRAGLPSLGILKMSKMCEEMAGNPLWNWTEGWNKPRKDRGRVFSSLAIFLSHTNTLAVPSELRTIWLAIMFTPPPQKKTRFNFTQYAEIRQFWNFWKVKIVLCTFTMCIYTRTVAFWSTAFDITILEDGSLWLLSAKFKKNVSQHEGRVMR